MLQTATFVTENYVARLPKFSTQRVFSKFPDVFLQSAVRPPGTQIQTWLKRLHAECNVDTAHLSPGVSQINTESSAWSHANPDEPDHKIPLSLVIKRIPQAGLPIQITLKSCNFWKHTEFTFPVYSTVIHLWECCNHPLWLLLNRDFWARFFNSMV